MSETEQTLNQKIIQLAQAAKLSSQVLAQLNAEEKNRALLAMATELENNADKIVTINQLDITTAKKNQLPPAFIDRLQLSKQGVLAIVDSIKKIVMLPEPIGKKLKTWQVDSGLVISRITVPLGVIAVIYESRPNVTADAAALGFKSGNAVLLRGGSECAETNKIIAECLQQGLQRVNLPAEIIQYIPTQDRAAVDLLLKLDEYIDVIVPRGGKCLIQRIREISRIPVFSHLDGLCHTYVHESARLDMAKRIVCNAKMRRTGICGATETLLIDKAIANTFLPEIIDALTEKHCEVRGDKASQIIDSRIQVADEQDWSSEYLDAIISVKVVENIQQAMAHIAKYGSHHTDAIITENESAAALFLQQVDSAIVMHNSSTQFADGGEFGMGAEIGIATGKLHARGPVGLEQLTTFKYTVKGAGQIRA